MRKICLAIITILLIFAFVACTNDNPLQTSDDFPESSSVSESSSVPDSSSAPDSSSTPDSSIPPSEENGEWEDIEFPRP